MAKTGSQDNFVAYVAAAIVIGLVSIFVLSWNYLKTSGKVVPEIAYAKFGPYRIETQAFSLTATIAVQTSAADTDWANRHREAINVVIKKVLADSDPNTIKAANRLEILQDALAKACNGALNTKAVQAVLLTDFTFEEHTSY